MDDFDVFLNHRGPDVKGGFIAHLHAALRSAGLNPFLDKKSLAIGGPAFGSIDAALKVARIHVAVVSRGYAESKYCLCELVVMLRSGKPVIPVFYDVEPAHLRRVENGPFAAAFEKHKSRETEEQVEQWADALGKLADITGCCFRLSDYEGDEAELKQKVVDAIMSFMPRTQALHVERHRVGIIDHVNTCVEKLEKMSTGTALLCVVGMGGVGKTSLVKEIYNYFIGCKKFQAMSFLKIDRNPHSSLEAAPSLSKRLQKQLLWDLLNVVKFHQSYEYWFQKLSRRGPILVVLDDVHDKIQFDNLILNQSLLARGSCIIVTSRDRNVLEKIVAGEKNVYFHKVTPLKYDDSQKLFNLHAFHNAEAPENFKDLAIDVSKACGGLPLALKVVGSSLYGKRTDEDQECIWPEAIDTLKKDPDIMNALKWSYDWLSESAKLMFVDIACIFYGWKKEEVLGIWKGCKNCLSCCECRTPHTSLRELIDKSLVELEYSSISYDDLLTMHGLLQDMGQGIGNINGSHLWDNNATKMVEDKNQVINKVRALNLTKSKKRKFEAKNFTKMTNLHYLILDDCNVSGNFGNISRELRLLRWRRMPSTQVPPILNFSNLVSLDFSQSTMIASTWIESNLALEGCPNLPRLNLSECKSITTIPDSIGRLAMLQVLDLTSCWNLQKLPSSIGQLRALRELHLYMCKSLEALPDTITVLPGLQVLFMDLCNSNMKLPTSIGRMKSLTWLDIDLDTKWQAIAIGQLNALEKLSVRGCTDEAITMLDSSGTLRNLAQLSQLWFVECAKPPQTIGLLTNLKNLNLYGCWDLEELPNSIGQLKALTELSLNYCVKVRTLPDSLGALTNLQHLLVARCGSFTNLPTSIGHLWSLFSLRIEGCGKLQRLPDSLSQLNALVVLHIFDCGRLVEDLGLFRVLQGLRIWGCTSITEPPRWTRRLMVLDSNFMDPALFYSFTTKTPFRQDLREVDLVRQDLRELEVVEINDCGFLRYVEDIPARYPILQRVYKLPCL